MPNALSPIVKAREVEVSFHVDETNRDEVLNIGELRKRGAHGFPNRVDLRLTTYLTVHNVLAIEDILFTPAPERKQNYMDGSANPQRAHITFKLIVWDAKDVVLAPENLLNHGATECLTATESSPKQLR